MVITLAQPVSHSMAVVSNGHTFTSIRSSKRVNRKGDADSSRSAEAAENHAEGRLCFACVAVIPQLYAAGKEKTKRGPWFVGATKVYSSVRADMILESITRRTHARWLNDLYRDSAPTKDSF